MPTLIDTTYPDLITDDESRALILGHELLYLLQAHPDSTLSRLILDWLGQALTDPHERALFNFPPLPQAAVLPFALPHKSA